MIRFTINLKNAPLAFIAHEKIRLPVLSVLRSPEPPFTVRKKQHVCACPKLALCEPHRRTEGQVIPIPGLLGATCLATLEGEKRIGDGLELLLGANYLAVPYVFLLSSLR